MATCTRCHQHLPTGAHWPDGRICRYCYLQARLHTGVCADCGTTTSLPGRNPAGKPTCTTCSGIRPAFTCHTCGRAVTAGRAPSCWWCVLADLLTRALDAGDGTIAPHLRPLAAGLLAMRRPQSGAAWVQRNHPTLADLATGRLPCTHDAVDQLPHGRATDYLRELLTHHGLLPPRDRRLADFQRWATTTLDTVAEPEQRRLLDQFVHWRLLRHLRTRSSPDHPLDHGPYQRAKQHLTTGIAFLDWLADRGRTLPEATQHDIDAWFSTGPTTTRHSLTLLSWTRHQRILPRRIQLPVIGTDTDTSAPISNEHRVAALRTLLLDDTLPIEDRVAGCLVILYGQPITKIATLRADDLDPTADHVRIRLGTHWLDVPEPLATLLRHAHTRRTMNTATNPTSPWLFPGQIPGQHRSHQRITTTLTALGIPPRAMRTTTWRTLVRQAPPPILANALGITPATALRHAQLASADWTTYTARRAHDH